MLPFFVTYTCVLLTSSAIVFLTYLRFGIDSASAYYVFWGAGYVFAVAWCLALAELCRYELRNFAGIWALVWRMLVLLSALLIGHAAIDAWRQPNVAAIFGAAFLRDLSFASIAILAVLLLIRNHYGLSLAPLQRSIAAGMCLTCAVDTMGYTVFRNILAGRLYSFFQIQERVLWPALEPQVRRVNDVWSSIHLLAFMVSIGIWSNALRKPLPEPARSPVLLPAEAYSRLSPAINVRLTSLNERLAELLKP